MKKLISVLAIIAILAVAVLSVGAVANAEVTDVPPGPAPTSGDGEPDGNQFIQPEAPGMGPAPNSGDGVNDGSGF